MLGSDIEILTASALKNTSVPVPDCLCYCDDDEGAPVDTHVNTKRWNQEEGAWLQRRRVAKSDGELHKDFLHLIVIGSAFYIMRFIKGRIIRDITLADLPPARRARIYDEMNAVLAAMHSTSRRDLQQC